MRQGPPPRMYATSLGLFMLDLLTRPSGRKHPDVRRPHLCSVFGTKYPWPHTYGVYCILWAVILQHQHPAVHPSHGWCHSWVHSLSSQRGHSPHLGCTWTCKTGALSSLESAWIKRTKHTFKVKLMAVIDVSHLSLSVTCESPLSLCLGTEMLIKRQLEQQVSSCSEGKGKGFTGEWLRHGTEKKVWWQYCFNLLDR